MRDPTPSLVLCGALVVAAIACVPTFGHHTAAWHATSVRTVRDSNLVGAAQADGTLDATACQSLCAVRSSITHVEGCSLSSMELRGDHLLCFHSDGEGRPTHRSHPPIPPELSAADETTRVPFSDCDRFCGAENSTCSVERAGAPPVPGEVFILCNYRVERHWVDSRF
jgi:hypothetical protein